MSIVGNPKKNGTYGIVGRAGMKLGMVTKKDIPSNQVTPKLLQDIAEKWPDDYFYDTERKDLYLLIY